MHIVFDIETFPNVFTFAAEHVDAPFKWSFEISDWRDDRQELLAFLHHLQHINARMIGFNNLGFDYPVLHMFMRMGGTDAATLYQKAQAIISSQAAEDDSRWVHGVYPGDRYIEQLDLYKIHHFDNKARATSLKALEFNMRAESIEGLPFPVGSLLRQENVATLKEYNAYDVSMTKRFYHESLDMIRFREELTRKYNRDFMNHNDTKIGKDYFIMRLEEAGVQCYDYSPDGREPKQTRRPAINLRDAVLPGLQFQQPEFTRVMDWLKSQTITETKGVFKDTKATVDGFTFVFGLGGIHGSVENQSIYADAEYAIVDLDVASYYPNLAISNEFYPEHLGRTFVLIYKYLFEQRKTYPKKSAESAMLKLALNGVYGDSNNKFSVFYDPLFTMKITLNGQLLLCLLAEQMLTIPGLRLLQVNTDGLTVRVPRTQLPMVDAVRESWQTVTRLQLETAQYSRMFIRDVNNYIAQYEDGSVKRKGAYEYRRGWHQDTSALVIPKVAEQVLLHGKGIMDSLSSWQEPLDFMLRAKVPRSSFLGVERDGQPPVQLPNLTRYYISTQGGYLYKWMPPLKGKTDWRKIAIDSGWRVQTCNTIDPAAEYSFDLTYYAQEVEKLCLQIA